MKLTKVEKQEGAKIALSILVEREEFEAYLEKSYRQNVKKINIQGFRKGKAPRKMIEKLYGPEVFYEDAMDACYPEAYQFALDESNVEPIDRPSLTDFNVDENGFAFTAIVPVKPEIEITGYKGLEAVKPEAVVTEEEIAAEIENLRNRNARLVGVDRPAQTGDTVLIDFEGFVDEVAFEGGKGENYALELGSNSFIPGFEEQLVGKSAGEDAEVNVSFPEEYHAEELAGKAAIFKCMVHEVKMNERPEADDEFAKDISEFDTLEEYKADLKSKMLTAKENRANNDYEENLMDKLIEGFEGEIPDAMVESQIDRISEDFNYRLMMQGLNLDSYLKMNQMEEKGFRRLFRPRAERQVKIRLSLEKIAQLENLTVTEEEVDAEIARLAEENKMTVEKVLEIVRKISIRSDMEVQKASDLVKAHATAVPPAPEADEPDAEAPNATEEAPEKKKVVPKKKAAPKAEDETEE